MIRIILRYLGLLSLCLLPALSSASAIRYSTVAYNNSSWGCAEHGYVDGEVAYMASNYPVYKDDGTGSSSGTYGAPDAPIYCMQHGPGMGQWFLDNIAPGYLLQISQSTQDSVVANWDSTPGYTMVAKYDLAVIFPDEYADPWQEQCGTRPTTMSGYIKWLDGGSVPQFICDVGCEYQVSSLSVILQAYDEYGKIQEGMVTSNSELAITDQVCDASNYPSSFKPGPRDMPGTEEPVDTDDPVDYGGSDPLDPNWQPSSDATVAELQAINDRLSDVVSSNRDISGDLDAVKGAITGNANITNGHLQRIGDAQAAETEVVRQNRQDLEDASSLLDQATAGTPNLTDPGASFVDTQDLDLSSYLDDYTSVAPPRSAVCPDPYSLEFSFGPKVIEYDYFCDLADQANPFVIVIFTWLCSLIVLRSVQEVI